MKTCTKCSNTLSITFFFKKGYKPDGSVIYCARCKDCMKDKRAEYQKQWRLNNPDKHKECKKKEWQEIKANPEKLKKHYEQIAKWTSMHRVYNPDKAKIIKNRYKEELHDEYIKKVLLSRSYGVLSAKDITTDMIVMKRQQLILKRKLRNHE